MATANITPKETPVEPSGSSEIINLIWRVHAALDNVYGKNWSKQNPQQVALFLQALATKELAVEVGALREIIASGTGGITVGLEQNAG